MIPVKNISSTAQFYPVDVDGTQMEVLAVKAPDGTIRTAFNTCQVCYDSGRGYYKAGRRCSCMPELREPLSYEPGRSGGQGAAIPGLFLTRIRP